MRDLDEAGLPPVVGRISRLLRSFDAAVYLVGGSVRDLLLGRVPKDLDFLVFGPMERFARMVARTVGGKAIFLGQNDKALWRVVGAGIELDLAPPRGPDLMSDLQGRDFTVNSLAWSMNECRVVDLTGGLRDLDRRLIRMTREDVFRQDPVRLLRAFRFAAALDFMIEENTFSRIGIDRRLIGASAPERIGAELLSLLGSGRAAGGIRNMGRCGLLGELLPEACGSAGEYEAEAAAKRFEHSVAVIERLEEIDETPERVFPDYAGAVAAWFGEARNRALLKLAVLLGDCKKSSPAGPNRRVRGREPAEGAGSVLSEYPILALGERLALSNKDLRRLSELAAGHPAPFPPPTRERSGRAAESDILGALRFMGHNAVGLLAGSLAELDAARRSSGAREADYTLFLEQSNKALQVYFDTYLPRLHEPRWIDGADLRALGFPPGPRYREILEEVEALRLEGRLPDRAAALEWVRERLRLP